MYLAFVSYNIIIVFEIFKKILTVTLTCFSTLDFCIFPGATFFPYFATHFPPFHTTFRASNSVRKTLQRVSAMTKSLLSLVLARPQFFLYFQDTLLRQLLLLRSYVVARGGYIIMYCTTTVVVVKSRVLQNLLPFALQK